MTFKELDLKRIEKAVGNLCRRRSLPGMLDRVRIDYRVKGHEVLIYERRSFGKPSHWVEHGVAKLRFVATAGEWRLFWQRQSLKWQGYEPRSSSRQLEDLVAEIDRDPHGCFFG